MSDLPARLRHLVRERDYDAERCYEAGRPGEACRIYHKMVTELVAALVGAEPPADQSVRCNICDQPIMHELVCEDCLPERGYVKVPAPPGAASPRVPETTAESQHKIDIALACASGRHSWWHPQNGPEQCRYCLVEAPRVGAPAETTTNEDDPTRGDGL